MVIAPRTHPICIAMKLCIEKTAMPRVRAGISFALAGAMDDLDRAA